MGSAFVHGWVSLPTQGEAFLEHGVPREVRVEVAASKAGVDIERLADEVFELAGLNVTFGSWEPIEDTEAVQAAVRVHAQDLPEVMRRLAHATAETFFDRYRKPIGADDTDFDDEAYAQDFSAALDICGLHWGQVDAGVLRDAYRDELHRTTEQIAASPAR